MEASAPKRVLTETTYQETRALNTGSGSELLPDDLRARLANVGRRVRYNVSQGYASNRTTPNATPNVSPSKIQPPIPYNTPEVSPVKGASSRGGIFRTEHEIIQEAVEEAISGDIDGSGDVKPLVFNLGVEKKRGRIDESESEDEPEVADQNADQETMQGVIGRSIKPLPRKKAPPLAPPSLAPAKSIDSVAGTALQDDGDTNPFLVSSSDSVASH